MREEINGLAALGIYWDVHRVEKWWFFSDNSWRINRNTFFSGETTQLNNILLSASNICEAFPADADSPKVIHSVYAEKQR